MINKVSLNDSFSKCMKGACLGVFLFVVTFLILTQSPLHIWIGSDSGTDSSVFMTVAMMMDKGYMPYRDTFDHKGPLVYLINYLGRQISAYRGVWVIEFVSMFVTLLFIYKIACLKCGKALSCIILLVSTSFIFGYFHGGNYTEEYAMPLISGALFIFLDYFINLRISRIRLIFCGLFLGGVCLLRPNMISVWLSFCIAVLIKCIKGGGKNFQDLKRFILYFSLGFFALVAPIMLWIFINNSFIDFWDEYIRFNILYVSSFNVVWWKSFFSFCNNPMIIFAIIISVYMSCKAENRFLYGAYCFYLICTFLTIDMSGKGLKHYGMILIPAIVFPIASLFDICKENFPADKGRTETIFVIVFFLCTIVIPNWYPIISELPEIYRLREEENNSWLVNEVCRVVCENTQNDDKISVYGNRDIIYLLSDREHATKYSYQFPIGQVNPNIMQEYFEELRTEKPKVIVIQQERFDNKIETFLNNNDYLLIWSEAGNDKTKTLVYKR